MAAPPSGPHAPEDDPLAELADWARTVERRTIRRRRLDRATALFRLRKRVGRKRGRRGGAVRSVIVPLLTAALVAAAFVMASLYWPRGDRYAKEAVPSGIRATSTGHAPGDMGPFANTPAEAFPAGEAGLTVPAARAVAGFSATVVAADLGTVRKALVASHLDHRMLVDHDPSVFIQLLLSGQHRALADDIAAGRDGVLAVRIAPDARLVAEPPRVSGATTYRAGDWYGTPALEVITNYVWVYGFDEPDGWAGSRIVEVHGEEHWFFPRDRHGGMALGDTHGYWYEMDCAATGKGFTAPYAGDYTGSATSTEPPSAYFQPDHTLDLPPGCG